MTQLSIILAGVLTPIVTGLIFTFSREEKTTKHTVGIPKSIRNIGALSAAFAVLLYLAFLAFKTEALVFVSFVFGMVGGCFLYIYNSLRIYYDKNRFIVKKIFRKEQIFKYTQIQGVIMNDSSSFILVLDNCRIRVDSLSIGNSAFLFYIQNRYWRLHNKPLPELKFSLFNGNVKQPGPIVFFSILGGIFYTILAICVTAKYYPTGNIFPIFVVWLIVVLYWGVCCVGYYVLSNAKQYPRLASLFVKKDYRNW